MASQSPPNSLLCFPTHFVLITKYKGTGVLYIKSTGTKSVGKHRRLLGGYWEAIGRLLGGYWDGAAAVDPRRLPCVIQGAREGMLRLCHIPGTPLLVAPTALFAFQTEIQFQVGF